MAIKNLKAKMIKEAYKMITDEGFDNFSVRILSKKLNVSHNAMYKHFSSKAELLFEVVKLGFDNLTSAFIRIKESTDIDEITKYKEILYVHIEFALKNPDVYRLMYNFDLINSELPEDLTNTYATNYKTAAETVEEAIKIGKFKDASVFTMANTTWAFAHGMALLLIDNIIPKMENVDSLPQLLKVQANNKEVSVRDIVKHSIDLLFDGLIAT
jgi:AcrR family transcriptional regulator